MRKHYGLPQSVEERNVPVKCNVCETQNHPNQEICWRCGKALSLKSTIEISEKQIFGNILKNLSISHYLT